MKKLILSVAVVMMSMSMLTYAQDTKVEPAPTDSVPAQEPQKEEPKASLVCMTDEPAPTDSVPAQEPQKEDPKASLVCMTDEPAPTDSVPAREPQKKEPQKSASIA